MYIQTHLTKHENNFNIPSYVEIMQMLKFSQGKKFLLRQYLTIVEWLA